MTSANKTVTSSFLLILESISKKLVGLVSTLILARLLTPEDFGIVAVATLAFGLLEVLTQTGTQQYVSTVEKINDKILNTAFTLNLAIKSFIAVIFACATPWVAEYYNDARLVPVLLIFSVILLIQGISNPQLMVLKRQQNYGKIVKLIVISKLLSTIFAVTLALITKSYWALVGGQFLAYTLPIIGSYFIAPYKPQLTLSNVRTQLSFSGWLIPSSILGYFRTQIDTILVSKFFDNATLGSYHVMKFLAFIPSLHIVGPITQPLLAQLASVKDNAKYFAKMFNVSLLVTLAVAVPISHLLFFYADIIIVTFLGEQWVDYSNLFSLFGLVVFFTAIFNHANNCFLIFNKTRICFFVEIGSALTIVSVLLLSSFDNPDQFATKKIGLEIALSIALFIFAAIKFTNVKHFFTASFLTISIIGCSVLSNYLSEIITGHPETFFSLIFTTIVYFVFYILFIVVMTKIFSSIFGECQYLENFFTEKLNKILKRNQQTS